MECDVCRRRGGAPGGGAGAKNKRLSRFDKSGDSVRVVTTHQPVGRVAEWTHEVTRFVGYYRLQIFWCTLYTLVNVGIFVERAYCTLNCCYHPCIGCMYLH